MEDRAADLCLAHPALSLRVVDDAEMIEKGMGLIHGVGMAATTPPRIVYIEYKGDPSSEKVLALVGKGLCCECRSSSESGRSSARIPSRRRESPPKQPLQLADDTGGLNLKGDPGNMYIDKHGAW